MTPAYIIFTKKMARKRRRKLYRHIAPAMTLGMGAAGMGVLGSGLTSAGVTHHGLTGGATAMAGFVGPTAAIGGAGMTMEMMRELNYKRKKRR